jgi:hypothetical protein
VKDFVSQLIFLYFGTWAGENFPRRIRGPMVIGDPGSEEIR